MYRDRVRWGLAIGIMVLAGPAQAATPYDPAVMSARIDQLIAARWRELGVQPAERADDAEFFRRLSIDLNGRIPTLTQLKDFLDDTRPDKRRIWTEILMRGADNRDLFIDHQANYWRTLLLSQSTNQQTAQFTGFQLESFLRRHLLESAAALPVKSGWGASTLTLDDLRRGDRPLRYDRMIRELLTTQGSTFFQASEGRPENIAGATSRLLLGVKLECAQCHDDRSGGSWTRTQFWEYAAFFANIQSEGQRRARSPSPAAGIPRIKIPDKNVWVEARFLDGQTPDFAGNRSPQEVLADWMTSTDNPFFARAAVNRMWHYFLGTGLVDPVDHMGTPDNPPSHPELLDELAQQFAANGFDLKWLIRSIVGSRVYQLTSRKTHDSQDDEKAFARMAVRGMSPEQLYESILQATEVRDHGPRQPSRFGIQPNTPRNEFLARFTNTSDKRTELQTSILQALFLMNGAFMSDQLTQSPALATIQKNTGSPVRRNIEELFLITLSRKPTAAESARLERFVADSGNRESALADIFWALLNSSEFGLNH